MGIYANVSPSQARFALMLEGAPFLKRYWDLDERTCDVEQLNQAIDYFSHGEQVMARFYLSVWLGDNRDFDLFEAVRTLDEYNRSIILQWIQTPFWP